MNEFENEKINETPETAEVVTEVSEPQVQKIDYKKEIFDYC